MDLVELKNEIVSDPQGIGYKNSATATDWKGDTVIADLINDPANGATITRKLIKPEEIFSSIPYTEYAAYDQAKRDYLDTILELAGGTGVIDATDTLTYNNLLEIFPSGSDARTNIIAKIQRQGSRAEILWGEGVTVSALDVGRAFNKIGA